MAKKRAAIVACVTTRNGLSIGRQSPSLSLRIFRYIYALISSTRLLQWPATDWMTRPSQECTSTNLHRVSKNSQNCFRQNFVKFPLTLIIFGTKMAKTIELCKVHSFFTSPNLCQRTTVYDADVLAIFVPKIVKVGGNLTKFWRKQFWLFFN